MCIRDRPSYRTIIEKRQVTSGAEQLSAFVSAVQFEAVKRGEPMAVRYMHTDADTWCIGVMENSTSSTACDCTKPAGDAAACEVDGELRVFLSTNLNYPKILDGVSGNDGFAFDPVRGLLVNPRATTEFQLLSETSMYALNVQVNGTGRVKMCSNSASDKYVPGYDEC